jgi:hypothetical protein
VEAYPHLFAEIGREQPRIYAYFSVHDPGLSVSEYSHLLPEAQFGFLRKGTFSLAGDRMDLTRCIWTVVFVRSELNGLVFTFLIQGIKPVSLVNRQGRFVPVYLNADMPQKTTISIAHLVRRACLHCGKNGCKLWYCKPCKQDGGAFFYCSRKCQRHDWGMHKLLCFFAPLSK